MNIALVFPESTFLIDPMVYPPLGLWYLGAQLEAQGHETEFFDLSEDKLPADGEFDQIWISATSPQLHAVRRHARTFEDYQKSAIVFGGSAPWANLDQSSIPGFDLVVAGEADQPHLVRDILELAEKRRGEVLQLGTQRFKGAMDNVLPPLRRWNHRYRSEIVDERTGARYRTASMFTSRGCPMACAFCESGRNGVIWDKFVRYEPVETVEAQLRELKDLGYDGIMFYDDILPLNKPRTLAILELMKKYDLKWRCFLRTDVIRAQGGYDYLKEMRDAGLLEVLAGVESGDDRIKANISKGTTIEDDTIVNAWCNDLGILFKASFILGLPGEDRESLERTRRWILDNKPDRVDVNTLIPFPGTPLTHQDLQHTFDLNWSEDFPEEFWYKGPRDSSQSLVSTSNLSAEEIQEFRDKLIAEIEAEGIPY